MTTASLIGALLVGAYFGFFVGTAVGERQRPPPDREP
jgi:hypothetical protein